MDNSYRNVRLERCQFWNVDLSGTSFENCSFSECTFGDIRLQRRGRRCLGFSSLIVASPALNLGPIKLPYLGQRRSTITFRSWALLSPGRRR